MRSKRWHTRPPDQSADLLHILALADGAAPSCGTVPCAARDIRRRPCYSPGFSFLLRKAWCAKDVPLPNTETRFSPFITSLNLKVSLFPLFIQTHFSSTVGFWKTIRYSPPYLNPAVYGLCWDQKPGSKIACTSPKGSQQNIEFLQRRLSGLWPLLFAS